MKDQRLKVFRSAVETLLESLDAVLRLARWSGTEAPPEPLVTSAAKLVDRLGAADRLVSARFNGPPAETAIALGICSAMKRLDVAYRAYRQQSESFPERAGDAAAALETEIAGVMAGASAWR